MTEHDPFMLSEIQTEFDEQNNSLNQCHTEGQAFSELDEQFVLPTENSSKGVLNDTYQNNYKPSVTSDEHTDVSHLPQESKGDKHEIKKNDVDKKTITAKENQIEMPKNVCVEYERVQSTPASEDSIRMERGKDSANQLNGKNYFNQENGKNIVETGNGKVVNREESREERTPSDSTEICVKLEEDDANSSEITKPVGGTETIHSSDCNGQPNSNAVQHVKPSKFNCVMCDNHFIDLIQLESHVKSHNEVLHFSILLKKVGKENEERTKNVISSLIELARSSDINLSKLGTLFQKEGVTKRKYNTAKRRRKSKPRKKEVEPNGDEGGDGDLWNEIIDDEPQDNEKDDPTYGTNQKDLENGTIEGASKRLRRRVKRESEKVDLSDDDTEEAEEEAKTDIEKTEKCEDTPQTDGEKEWNDIMGSDFQLVKKEGPGRPAYGLDCPVCNKFITGRSKLRLHMKKEHGMFKSTAVRSGYKGNIKTHTCEICGQKVKTLKRLKAHLLDKHKVTLSSNAKMYKCPLCDAFFGRRSELKEHRTEAHPGQSEHICTFCGKMFMSGSLLEKHMRNHTGEKPYQCHLCPKAFTINTKLQEHIRQHTGERPFVCDICGAKFNRSCNKKRHMLIHEGKYPHTCEICGKGFRDIGPLTLHIRRHTGDKPYKCEDPNCNMAFITRGELECHRAKHTQKREHLCSLCGAEFLYKGDLRRHAKLHTGERPYKCSDCNAAFTRNQHLKHHWQSHHASGARVHKEWKPRKKPEQFGLPKQSSLLTTPPQSSVLPSMPITSTVQQPSRFHPQQPQQQQQQHLQQQQQQNNTCVVCNQWFPSESALKAHGVIHTMDSDHMFLNMASTCRQDYNPLSGVQLNNLPAPVPGSVEVCTLCNILITEPGNLQMHLQNVHGQYS